jgi:hypothetical protein
VITYEEISDLARFIFSYQESSPESVSKVALREELKRQSVLLQEKLTPDGQANVQKLVERIVRQKTHHAELEAATAASSSALQKHLLQSERSFFDFERYLNEAEREAEKMGIDSCQATSRGRPSAKEQPQLAI